MYAGDIATEPFAVNSNMVMLTNAIVYKHVLVF